ncbi:helix-turn-helix domain-containing protein [Emticicia fontis]
MKRLRYQDLKGDDLIISAHIGLNKLEFETLAKEFNQVVETHFIHFTIEGKIRQRQSKSRKNSVFVEWSDLLLFILVYLKTNPLQIVFATSFGLTQPKSSMWLKLASNFLLETLAKGNVLPERKSERIAKCIENLDKILIDATEREVYRSIDYQTQQEYYSGKKKLILLRTSS